MKPEIRNLSIAWQEAAKDLGICVKAPFKLKDKKGRIFYYSAYIPDFGSPNGALVLLIKPPKFDHDSQAEECAKQNGYWYSFLNTELYSSYNRSEFISMLDDWQYFGSANKKPSWYTGAPWGIKKKRTKS